MPQGYRGDLLMFTVRWKAKKQLLLLLSYVADLGRSGGVELMPSSGFLPTLHTSSQTA